MKLTFNRPHKSLRSLAPTELPDFTVLTGVNGAGKSHLLEAIENGAVSIEGIAPNQPNGPTLIRRFDWVSLVPQDTGAFSAAQISTEQASLWAEIEQHRQQALSQMRDTLRQLGAPGLEALSVKRLLSLTTPELSTLGFPAGNESTALNLIHRATQNANAHVTQLFVRNQPQLRPRLVSELSKATGMPLLAIDIADFHRGFPKSWQPIDLFQQSFARLFTDWQRHWQRNQVKVSGKARGQSVEPLSDTEFLAAHGGPPWDAVNEVLDAAELGFRINAPNLWEDWPYEPILSDSARGIEIRFADLSSGERIVMSFALCLYHSSGAGSAAEFPAALLFDEIDAPLHPSMTRSLLRTIEQALVGRRGIKVILTTHSPSTVALAADASLFAMRKVGEPRLARASKDAALGILTAGVPTLSVSFENRRQVFVESRHDAELYTGLFQRCKAELDPEISLAFISAGFDRNSNCDQVKSIVQQLHEGGNRTALGVVDWDLTNQSAGPIYVLGESERYSIENFLLDPALLALLLLREKIVKPERLGLAPERRFVDCTKLSNGELQAIADFVIREVGGARATPLPAGQGAPPVSFRYGNGAEVLAPEWFAQMQGHALEDAVRNAFPQLNAFRREPGVKAAVLERVIDEFPTLIPASIVALFAALQRSPSTLGPA